MSYHFKQGYRPGDWPIDCAICGQRCWFSDSKKLTTYTGRGGYRVCPDDVDPIDYGLVPYKIRTEKPVPFALNLLPSFPPTADTDASIIAMGYETYDPMAITPAELFAARDTNTNTWETITLNWSTNTSKWDAS